MYRERKAERGTLLEGLLKKRWVRKQGGVKETGERERGSR